MKKMLIMIFLIALMAVSLAGCKSQDIVDDNTGQKIGEVKKDGDSTTVTIDMTENVGEGQPCEYDGQCGAFSDMKACKNGRCVDIECKFLSHCDGDADLCLQGKCMTDAELAERFKFWKLNERCQGTCNACLTGGFKSSMVSGTGTEEYRLCLDCMSDIDCKEGYWCDVGKCVASDGSASASAPVPNSEPVAEPEVSAEEDVEVAPVDTDVGSGDPILGMWDRKGFHYYFKENGDMALSDSGVVKGQWERVSGDKYMLKWKSYSYIDDVTLSEDGNTLEGIRRVREEEVKLIRLE